MALIDTAGDLVHIEKNYRTWKKPVYWAGYAGSGRTDTLLSFCARRNHRKYFSFRDLDSKFALRMFSGRLPDAPACKDWLDFFAQLGRLHQDSFHTLVFDHFDERDDKDQFLEAACAYLRVPETNCLILLSVRNRFREHRINRRMFTYTPAYLQRAFPKMTDEDRIRLLAVSNGYPARIERYDDQISFAENLQRLFHPSSEFFRNGYQPLQQAFRSPETYTPILYALAIGFHRLAEIAAFAGYPNNKCGKYLNMLIDEEIVVTRPGTQNDRRASREYFIRDGMLALWLKLVLPLQERAADAVDPADVLSYIDEQLVPRCFRDHCFLWIKKHRQHLLRGELHLEDPKNYNVKSGKTTFDYVQEENHHRLFIKIWSDIGGRYGVKEYENIEEASMRISPFYENDYVLFSIHRFRDGLWKLTQKYENVRLVEGRFLSY